MLIFKKKTVFCSKRKNNEIESFFCTTSNDCSSCLSIILKKRQLAFSVVEDHVTIMMLTIDRGLSWLSIGLVCKRSWIQTQVGATLRVFKLLRRKCCICNDVCKWLLTFKSSQIRTIDWRWHFKVYKLCGMFKRNPHTYCKEQSSTFLVLWPRVLFVYITLHSQAKLDPKKKKHDHNESC